MRPKSPRNISKCSHSMWLDIRHSLIILGLKPHMTHRLQCSSPNTSGTKPPISASKRLFHMGDELAAELDHSTSDSKELAKALLLTAWENGKHSTKTGLNIAPVLTGTVLTSRSMPNKRSCLLVLWVCCQSFDRKIQALDWHQVSIKSSSSTQHQ